MSYGKQDMNAIHPVYGKTFGELRHMCKCANCRKLVMKNETIAVNERHYCKECHAEMVKDE